MVEVYISLGSNINPEKNIVHALTLVSSYVNIRAISTVYRTQPLDTHSPSKFYNCVIKVETNIEPRTLKFEILRFIEEKLGRKRENDKYAPRTIDLDILIYGKLSISTSDLKIPDPDILTRSFLALPLYELNPTLILSHFNISIKQVADRLKNHNMTPLTEYTNSIKQQHNI